MHVGSYRRMVLPATPLSCLLGMALMLLVHVAIRPLASRVLAVLTASSEAGSWLLELTAILLLGGFVAAGGGVGKLALHLRRQRMEEPGAPPPSLGMKRSRVVPA